MNQLMVKRIIDEANYVIKTKDTIRNVANVFNISKSTVHKDLHDRLLYVNKELYNKVSDIMQYHIYMRHIRGGQSTKKKYKKLA